MDEFVFLMIGVGIIVIVFIAYSIVEGSSDAPKQVVAQIKSTERPDLIQDANVTIDLVIQKLENFKIHVIQGRKAGFTEKDVHKQLETYFKDIFQTVTMEHGIESKNAKSIDIDLGNGKVGVEVKLASEIFKEGGWDRAIGQMVKYTRLKYKNDNLIFLVAGFDEDKRNSMLAEFEDDTLHHRCKFKFISAGSKLVATTLP